VEKWVLEERDKKEEKNIIEDFNDGWGKTSPYI